MRYKVDQEKISVVLLDKFLTFRKLSEESGVSYQTVCDCCGKKNQPVTMPTLEKLCKALSCRPSQIVRMEAGEA